MMYEFIGGLVLGLGVILITNRLVKVILDTLEVKGDNKEENWEDDTDWDWYEYDELDSRDDK